MQQQKTNSQWNEFLDKWYDKLLKPEVLHGEWWVVTDAFDEEEAFFPADLFTKEQAINAFLGNTNSLTRTGSCKGKTGWGARLSAPGYLDSTEWSLFESEQEAQEYLMEVYGDE